MSPLDASELFEALRRLALPSGHYAVFGSGPLAIRGLIEEVSDLDVITRGPAWAAVEGLGTTVMYGEIRTVDLGNGLTFGRSWAFGGFDIDRLIDEAEVIDGLPFVRLGPVLEYKRIAGRPKDLLHIAAVEDAGLDV